MGITTTITITIPITIVGGGGGAVVVVNGHHDSPIISNIVISMNNIIIITIPLHESALVVMHPDLENILPNPNLLAELLHQALVLLPHLPPKSLRQLLHLLLLLSGEFRPEPLPSHHRHRVDAAVGLVMGGRSGVAAGAEGE